MIKRPLSKPPTTCKEQVSLLQKRGMIIDNIETACFFLQHINYYRPGAYWLPFEVNPVTHDFATGTNFSTVLALYNFDRELKLRPFNNEVQHPGLLIHVREKQIA